MLSSSPWPDELFAEAPSGARLRLVADDGEAHVMVLPLDRWHGEPGPGEHALLARAKGPVLDIGCGPGRHVAALAEAGVSALGIDLSGAAVRAARHRGAPAMQASVFGYVPGAGSWATALLIDGNIGIGGDPVALLRRVSELLTLDGSVLVEMEQGVTLRMFEACVEEGPRIGHRFSWARVGPSQMHALATEAGFAVEEIWRSEGRWFAHLSR